MFKLLVLSGVLSVGLCFGFGGYSEIQPNELGHFEDILMQTNAVLGKYTIQKVETQVVAGMNIKYTLQQAGHSGTCEIVVWQHLQGVRQVTSNTCSPPKSRREFFAGGYSSVTNTVEAQKYEKILAKHQGSKELGLTQSDYKVLNIQTQVVAGLNLKFTLQLTNGTICEAVMFYQPWINNEQITKNDCLTGKSTRQIIDNGGLPGGWSSVAVTNKDIQDCLTTAVDRVNLMSNNIYRMVESQVSAKEQVVAGVNYAVSFHVVPSTCMNGMESKGKLSDRCAIDANIAMQPMAWKATCFKNLQGHLNFRGVIMKPKKKEPSVINKLDNGLVKTLTPINIMTNGVVQMQKTPMGLSRDQISQSFLRDYNEPNLTQLRKRRSVDSLKQTLKNAFMKKDTSGHMNGMGGMRGHMNDMGNMDDMMGDLKDTMGNIGGHMNDMGNMDGMMGDLKDTMGNIGGHMNDMGNMDDMMGDLKDTMGNIGGHMNDMGNMDDMMGDLKDTMGNMRGHMKDIVGHMNDMGNMDDMMGDLKDTMGNMRGHMKDIKSMKHMLGQDGHDFIKHGLEEKLLGLDSHDLLDHGLKLVGVDSHVLVEHGEKLLGGDDHDLVNHGEKLLGGDDHDLVNHGEKLLGGDDHDLVNHGEKLLGGDDHDLVNHGEKLLGGDNHDLVQHGEKLLGGDDHDLVNHGEKLLGGDDHDLVNHGEKLLGGDNHDLVQHGEKLLGGDDHDLVNHGEKLLGGDDHDLVNHGEKLLGGDDHDLVNHGEKLLGGDDHDLVNHGEKLLGGDDHDLVNHRETLLGGDGHDYCHPGMFAEFKMKFNKMYGSDKEEERRFTTFCNNMRTARKLQEKEQGTAVYGATKFADLTNDEFRQYVGKKWDITAKWGMKQATIPRGRAPDSFDWRDHDAVTPVKNQGSCGSCWAFSTTGNIEGQWAIKKRKLVSLSEQELVDCDKVDEGCNGGLPSQAYKEIERIGGMETETDYSYKGVDEKCFFNRTDVKVYINDSVAISSNETEIASWLAANGPISIGINAFAMQFYMGGISHPWKMFCNPKNLDHGVLIVGYGVQGTKPYWIVKNSWGPDWGEKGYYMVYRGDGVCGLNTMCTSAVIF